MELGLFILLFFTAVAPPILTVTREYFLIQEGKTWTDAQAYCRDKYTDLAIIKSNEDMVQLHHESQRQQFSSSAWIGLYNDITSWRWSLGNEPLGIVTQWMWGQPNNKNGHEECVGVNLEGWSDEPCTDTHSFVCFNARNIVSKRYIHIYNSMTWYEARNYCRQHHTDLASARDAIEYLAVKNPDFAFSWLGLFRESWKWSDKTNFSAISWMSQQPDNAHGHEDCGYINNGQVGDAGCSDIMPFFCYSVYTRKQQIIRMKMKFDQDVNDPSVKAAILEQIKQKLKDHEMAENITVKWREQPNGMVFHKIENNTTAKKDEL